MIGSKLLGRLNTSHQALAARMTSLELEAAQQHVATSEAERELDRMKQEHAGLEREKAKAGKENEVLATKTELRKRQIERAMFLVRKREEMFKNDIEGREVIQIVLKALTEDDADQGIFSIREMSEEEMDKIIYKLTETRQKIFKWIILITMGIINRETKVVDDQLRIRLSTSRDIN